MPSIYDRDGLRPILIPEDKTPEYILIIITIFIMLAFAAYLIWLVKSEPPPPNVIQSCAPGQCITNIVNGIKQCPANPGDVLQYDPGTEVCNSPFTCENPATPNAVLADGSTDPNGVCDPGVTCRCVQNPQCGSHILSIFSTANGSPYQSLTNQRISFVQSTGYIDLADNLQLDTPIHYESPVLQFCGVAKSWVTDGRLWPNKCLNGTLAYVPEDPVSFNASLTDTTPLSCVQGTDCPTGEIGFWDFRINKVTCIPDQ